MGMNTHIKTILDRKARLLEARPKVGQNTVTTQVRVTSGLACEIERAIRRRLSAKLGPHPETGGSAATGGRDPVEQ